MVMYRYAANTVAIAESQITFYFKFERSTFLTIKYKMGIYSTGKQTMIEINRDKQGNGVPLDRLVINLLQARSQLIVAHIRTVLKCRFYRSKPTLLPSL